MTRRGALLLTAGAGILVAGTGTGAWLLLFPSRRLTKRLNACRSEPWLEMAGDQNLYRPMTITEVEQAEQYSDPLGLSPNLPFGYLNPAWQRFVAAKPLGAELWAFQDPWTYKTKGYAWVRLGKIHSEIAVRG